MSKAMEVYIMLQTVLTVVHVILSIILIAVVLFQSGKSAGLSGSIAGGAETFFGKNKARTLDGILGKLTGIVAILFIATSFVLSLILK
jgi:preprotein translocase subunit SecG